jgi:hypothetical protein
MPLRADGRNDFGTVHIRHDALLAKLPNDIDPGTITLANAGGK